MSDSNDPAARGWGTWRYRGGKRPPFAQEPGPDQESVWDYPRPPRIEPDARRVEVLAGKSRIADTRAALRVLETASPPTFYLPPGDVRTELLEPTVGATFCEWKGEAHYFDLVLGGSRVARVAWSYPSPAHRFEALAGYLSFYPARVECRVNGERVRSQPGRYYGGWVTGELVGPFKGEPGTESW